MIFPINEDLEYFMLTAKVTHSKQSLISQDINLVPANAKCRRTIALSVLISCLLWKLFSLSFGLCGIIVLGPDVHLIEEIIVSEKKEDAFISKLNSSQYCYADGTFTKLQSPIIASFELILNRKKW